jgi:diguanylate cyclase (GGDEF)-like protein
MTVTEAIAVALLGLGLGGGLGWALTRRAYRKRLHEQSQSLEQAKCEARTDALTGLANRKGFDEQLALMTAIARRYNSGLALALFDLDGLKQMNDQHGHAGGDAALVHFARVLTSSSRESDFVARIGGDEFAVILPQSDLDGAGVLARRILKALGESRAPTSVSASAGVAEFEAGQSPAQLLERADRALYSAKQAGGTRPVGNAADVSGDHRSSDSSMR